MKTKSRWLSLLATVLCLIAFATAKAQSIDLRCIGDGAGVSLCGQPMAVPAAPIARVDENMWAYGACDFAGPTPRRNVIWSQVLNGLTLSNANIVGVAAEFERKYWDACSIGGGGGGWGITVPENILCYSGGTISKNQLPIRELMRMDFAGTASPPFCASAWQEVVYGVRNRDVACAAGYDTVGKSGGDFECRKMLVECFEVGNPITLLNGCKAQRESDYPSRRPGGVELERFYNSGGYFRLQAAPPKASDFWRTTWDRRVLAPPSSSSILANAQRADGSVWVFRPDGREMHNRRGGASALIERIVDAAGGAGWRLTTAEKEVEHYDASGRLLSVQLRAGWTYTLAYGSEGEVSSVNDSHGMSIAFTYEGGRLSGFVAPGNRTYSYAYDSIGRLIKVTHPDNTSKTYHYEHPKWVHALTGITDENGSRFATWTYDADGRADSSQHAGGAESVRLVYGSYSASANQGATHVTDAFGTLRSYYYEIVAGVRRITRISDPTANAFRSYDANGNLSSFKDAAGNQTTYVYDQARNLEVSRTEAFGSTVARTITTQWHPVYRLPTRITAPSGVPGVSEITDLLYDTRGNLIQKTITAGAKTRQWTTTFNEFGQVLSVDGPRTDVADITLYTYYGESDSCLGCRGNLKSITNALGHVTTFSDYEVDGQPTAITDANGVSMTMSYDQRGRLKSRTVNAGQALAEVTAYTYDSVGQLTRATLPDGSYLVYQYDAAHRLTEISDSLGNVIQYTLDAMGNRMKEDVFDPADRLVKTQLRIHDTLNRLYNVIGASGQKTAYAYDAIGNLKVSNDPLNRTSTASYDALSRLLGSVDALGGSTQYGYDARDRLTSVRDPLGNVTTYTYDGLGNMTKLASPDTGITSYVPDAAGNVLASTDARGLSLTYAYDALDRPTVASFAGGAVAFEYDNLTSAPFGRGRLSRITDPSGTTTFTYDAQGRVTTKTQTVGSAPSAKTFSLGYQHIAGRLTGMEYPSGRSVSYAFDAHGRVTGVAVAGQSVLSGVTYFPFGGVQGFTWANGQPYRRSFDADGRIASLTLGPATPLYDSESWSFTYDSLDRLTTATLPQGNALAYAYDANGNRKQETRASGSTSYAYGVGTNRLLTTSGVNARNFTYDPAGNLTGDGTLSFTYDGRGRLTQTSHGYRYLINGLGQRAAKMGPAVPTGTVYFVYDERGQLIGEYDATGALRQELIYLGDMPVASVRTIAGGGLAIYPIYTDHLNTPRLITDMSGRRVWEWKTDTFGAGAANENPDGLGAFAFNLRFPGQYYDAETGLHYNYYRDFDPSVGRYVQSDPVGLGGGVNPYGYVEANPIANSDVFGLDSYMCTQPLHALGDFGRRVYNPSWYNPLYHQYICVPDGNGGMSCGGQDRDDKPWGRGKPSNDSWNPDSCKKVEDNMCVEQCLLMKINDPNRPNYSLFGGGGRNAGSYNCHQWADRKLYECRLECKGK